MKNNGLTNVEKLELRLRRKKKLQTILLLLLAIIVVLSVTAPGKALWSRLFQISGFSVTSDAPLNIHFIDVGKADAILIECEGHTALLDAGTSAHGDVVVDYMERNGLSGLEYAISSHPDEDHLGGMKQVLSEVRTNMFVRSRWFPARYENVGDQLLKASVPEHITKPGDLLRLGSAELEILGPVREYEDTNNASLVVRLTYRDFTALFCGDMEKVAEKDLLEAGAMLDADLLKVAHHGSETSSTKKFLKAVSPEYAVISTGPDRNELPDEEVLVRLEKICPNVLRTDTDGCIVFSYDRSGVKFTTDMEKQGRKAS